MVSEASNKAVKVPSHSGELDVTKFLWVQTRRHLGLLIASPGEIVNPLLFFLLFTVVSCVLFWLFLLFGAWRNNSRAFLPHARLTRAIGARRRSHEPGFRTKPHAQLDAFVCTVTKN